MILNLESALSLNFCVIRVVIMSWINFIENKRTIRTLRKITTLASISFFARTNILMFFICFELVLLPIILIVLVYGSQPEKIRRLYYAIIYTGVFSISFVVEIIHLEGWFLNYYLSPIIYFLVIGLFLRKIPLFLLHSWLPKAHVEAPTSARILLAGVLLKVGLFGLIKIIILINIINFIELFLRIMGLLIMSLITCVSRERKVITAIRRITHINFSLYGLNILSITGNSGVSLLGISHGLVSSIIFRFVGFLYHFNGTRILFFLRGLIRYSIFLGFTIVIVYLTNAGVPVMLSFWGELLLFMVLINGRTLLLLGLIIYFFYSFYYSVYLLIHFRKRRQQINFRLSILNLNLIFIIRVISLLLWMW